MKKSILYLLLCTSILTQTSDIPSIRVVVANMQLEKKPSLGKIIERIKKTSDPHEILAAHTPKWICF